MTAPSRISTVCLPVQLGVLAEGQRHHEVGDEEQAVDRAEDLDAERPVVGALDVAGDEQEQEGGRLDQGDELEVAERHCGPER